MNLPRTQPVLLPRGQLGFRQMALGLETRRSRDRWPSSRPRWQQLPVLELLLVFPILENGRMGPSPGVQGVRPQYSSHSDHGCWGGEGREDRKPGLLPSVGAEGFRLPPARLAVRLAGGNWPF